LRFGGVSKRIAVKARYKGDLGAEKKMACAFNLLTIYGNGFISKTLLESRISSSLNISLTFFLLPW
jgi:hypothetical protein